MTDRQNEIVKAFVKSLEAYLPTIKEHDAQTRDEDLLPTAKLLLKYAKARLPKENPKEAEALLIEAGMKEELSEVDTAALDRWDDLNTLNKDIKAGLRSGEIKIDFKGHQQFPLDELVDLSTLEKHLGDYYCDKICSGHATTLLGTAKAGPDRNRADILISGADQWVVLAEPSCLSDCGICGADLGYEINLVQKLVRIIGEPCEFPGGMKEYSVSIDVPSGVLVVDDDLRGYFPPTKDHYVNHTIGIHDTSQDFADMDMIHMFVGNSCPSIFRAEDGNSLLVGNNSYDDDDVSGEELGTDETKVGGICTDLWWASLADVETLKNTGKFTDDDLERLDTITVKPGRYRATSYFHHSSYDAPLYFKVELLSELNTIFVEV